MLAVDTKLLDQRGKKKTQISADIAIAEYQHLLWFLIPKSLWVT